MSNYNEQTYKIIASVDTFNVRNGSAKPKSNSQSFWAVTQNQNEKNPKVSLKTSKE